MEKRDFEKVMFSMKQRNIFFIPGITNQIFVGIRLERQSSLFSLKHLQSKQSFLYQRRR